MKRSNLLLAPLAAALALGATMAVADAPASPFAGTWEGSFADVTNDTEGTMELSISAQGVIHGSFYNETLDVGGSINGTVREDGTLRVVLPGGGAAVFDGTIELAGGHLLIDATLKNDGANFLCDLTE